MTIFIGENDSSKTAIIRVLEFSLDNNLIPPDMFCKVGNEPEKRCEIKPTFNADPEKRREIPKDCIANNEICLKKIFALNDQNQAKQKILLNKYVFEKKELNDIESLKANPLKTLHKELGLENYTTAEDVKKKIKEFIRILLYININTSGSKSTVTKKSLEEIGFDKEFLDTNVVFIGTKEFEDAFSNNLTCRRLNTHRAKVSDQIWTEEDVEELRTSDKFSDSLKDRIGRYKTETNAEVDYLIKPEFGTKIANIIQQGYISEIEVRYILFTKINEIIR